MKQILITVDMQNDFIDGALGSREAVAIVPAVKERLKTFDGDVYFTRDTHGKDYLQTQEGKKLPIPHCIEGTHGWQITDALLPYVQNATVIDKPTFGSVALAQHLKAVHEKEPIASVTLVGLCTDSCVISNAMLIKATLPEVTVRVDAACCAGVTPHSHQTALDAMRACQIEIENA